MRPAVFTFHLGDLPIGRIRRLQSLGIAVGGSATCVAEARHVAELGVDFIVAQGVEAGGHRGTYLRDPYAAMTGTLALVRLIVRNVSAPVVASGGIMDGAGIAAGKAGNREFLSMYAGQAAPLSRALPAGELVARLHAEALEALDGLARLRR
jgi:NAD(P)H-dependent flavin oxidoreductase YrpB (nitropropane dioxygenase family)